jgi:hypothetical protein
MANEFNNIVANACKTNWLKKCKRNMMGQRERHHPKKKIDDKER